MTTDSSWDPTRWRDAQQLEHYENVQTPRSSAPSASDRSLQNAAFDSSHPQTWNAQSRIDIDQQALKLPSLTEPLADASTYQSWSRERHSPSPSGKYGFQRLTRLPEPASAWQSLRYDNDDRRNERRITDAPLTLHIPNSQDLHRTLPGYAVASSDIHSSTPQSSWSQQTTSLPSFATLQEHAGRKNDLDEDDVTSLSSPLPCRLCTKLVSKTREVANAVAELDEEVQASCNKTMKRSPKYPSASPMNVVSWILDTLRSAKDDLKASRESTRFSYQQASSSLSGIPARNMSPPSGVKRTAERWDQDDLPVPKRPRSGPSLEEAYEHRSTMTTDHRRASIDFITGDQFRRPTFSPPASESVPDSAYPRASSPGRGTRTLPSPTSTVYPHQSAHITGSPTSFSQREASDHIDSAKAAHIAELQHTISLKSLALQTLESEYTSLLHKIQRLTIQKQTMEKKSNVSEQEVNELTTRNEDLTQQLQALQEQLDESEKRREKQREEAGREKDQWLQMLDQGRRLQAKLEEDKRVLAQEIGSLKSDMARLQKEHESRVSNALRGPGSMESQNLRNLNQPRNDSGSYESTSGDVAALKAKVEMLRSSLEDARRHNQVLDERANEVVQRSTHLGSIIDRALDDEALTERESTPVNDRGKATQSGHVQPSPRKSRSPVQHSRTERANPSDKPRASVPANESIVQSARPGFPDLALATSANPQSASQCIASPKDTRTDVNPFKPARQGRQLPQGVHLWSTLGYEQPAEPTNPSPIGSFRPLNHEFFTTQSDPKRGPAQVANSPQVDNISPDPVMDDASSSSTRSANGQSPASSWAGPEGFGADLTPVSTLPTPGSAASLKQYPSYPFERRYSAETAGNMPPPPPRG